MDETQSTAVDEAALDRYESAWMSGRPLLIEECLPPKDDPRYLATLEELVLVDLEFQWGQVRSTSHTSETDRPKPMVDDYLMRFPELNSPQIIERLRQQAQAAQQESPDQRSLADVVGRSGREQCNPDSIEVRLNKVKGVVGGCWR